MWVVYTISHSETKEIYIGRTNDLKRRLSEHNSGKQTSTKRKNGQWGLAYAEAYKSKEDAIDRELKLKHHGRAIQELKKRISRSLEN